MFSLLMLLLLLLLLRVAPWINCCTLINNIYSADWFTMKEFLLNMTLPKKKYIYICICKCKCASFLGFFFLCFELKMNLTPLSIEKEAMKAKSAHFQVWVFCSCCCFVVAINCTAHITSIIVVVTVAAVSCY